MDIMDFLSYINSESIVDIREDEYQYCRNKVINIILSDLFLDKDIRVINAHPIGNILYVEVVEIPEMEEK